MIWLILLIPIAIGFLIWRIKKIPHGYVQWRTGIALRVTPSLDDFPPVKMRKVLEKIVSKRLPGIKRSLPVETIEEFTIPTRHGTIPARLYDHHSDPNLPIIIFMHGGGFCLGGFNVYEELTRRLARETNHKVVTLEYSLAPEYKFPIGHEQCEDAALWISNNVQLLKGNNEQIIPLGDSAGGNLALSTYFALKTKGLSGIIDAIVAVYPAIGGSDENTPSVKAYGKGYILTGPAMENFTAALIRSPEDLSNPLLALDKQDDLSDFPPLFVLSAEFDPLRSEVEGFAARVKAAGNNVYTKRYKGTVHSFFGIQIMGSQGPRAIRDIADWLNKYSENTIKKENLSISNA